MTALKERPAVPALRTPKPRALERLAPTLLAGTLAAAYIIFSPPSLDLAAHLLRAKLFDTQGFGLWNNWWYGGHHTPGYSVLFPPVAALVTPQIAGALAATATAALFESLARARFGRDATPGALWFGAATAVNLYTGRLTFAFGLLPAVATVLALQRRRDGWAAVLAVITALASPVAALFAALAAVACAVGRYVDGHRVAPAARALAVAASSLAPVLVLAVLFPEGGSEPFTLATLWPIPVIGVGALLALPRRDVSLRVAIALYLVGCVAAYAIATPVGSNAARLGPLLGGPLAALVFWPHRKALLLAVALPLFYLQWQAPFRDVHTANDDPATTAAYYRPLLHFLATRAGGPFRIEIPFTKFHWEAYEVAPEFPLARGWERQLDIEDNVIFYDHSLDAASYERWLHRLAVRYVAVANTTPDYSAKQEIALIDAGLPYLAEVWHTRDWRVYAVHAATPLAEGPATVTSLGPSDVALRATGPGSVLVHVRFTPYWALQGAPGCVAPAGDFTRLTLRRGGPAKLVIRFALDRVGARTARCS